MWTSAGVPPMAIGVCSVAVPAGGGGGDRPGCRSLVIGGCLRAQGGREAVGWPGYSRPLGGVWWLLGGGLGWVG